MTSASKHATRVVVRIAFRDWHREAERGPFAVRYGVVLQIESPAVRLGYFSRNIQTENFRFHMRDDGVGVIVWQAYRPNCNSRQRVELVGRE